MTRGGTAARENRADGSLVHVANVRHLWFLASRFGDEKAVGSGAHRKRLYPEGEKKTHYVLHIEHERKMNKGLRPRLLSVGSGSVSSPSRHAVQVSWD